MDILIIEDEFLLGLLLADALTDVGHRVLGPAACRAEALELLSGAPADLAFVDIELRGGESGIELARELERRGVRCVFATGQPDRAREQPDAALGLIAKPYSPGTVIEVVRYFEALFAGERLARVPRGLELFGRGPLGASVELVDRSASAIAPSVGLGALGAVPLATAAISAGPPQAQQRLEDAGVLEALTG
jgi:two-component system, response regulator PdtaR